MKAIFCLAIGAHSWKIAFLFYLIEISPKLEKTLRYGCDRCAEVLCKLNLARIGAQRVSLQLFDLLSRMYAAFVPEVAQEFISVLMPMHALVPAIVMAHLHHGIS